MRRGDAGGVTMPAEPGSARRKVEPEGSFKAGVAALAPTVEARARRPFFFTGTACAGVAVHVGVSTTTTVADRGVGAGMGPLATRLVLPRLLLYSLPTPLSLLM